MVTSVEPHSIPVNRATSSLVYFSFVCFCFVFLSSFFSFLFGSVFVFVLLFFVIAHHP